MCCFVLAFVCFLSLDLPVIWMGCACVINLDYRREGRLSEMSVMTCPESWHWRGKEQDLTPGMSLYKTHLFLLCELLFNATGQKV